MLLSEGCFLSYRFLTSQMPRIDLTRELLKHCCEDGTDLIFAEPLGRAEIEVTTKVITF